MSFSEIEKSYHPLVEVLPVGIFHMDSEGKFLHVNERWCEIVGIAREEALQKSFATGIHPEDRERVMEEWCDTVAHFSTLKSEYRMQHPDGSHVWVYGQVAPEISSNGDISGYIGTITDISKRKQIEETLEERNYFIENIMSSMPIGIIVLAVDDLKVHFMNPRTEEILGWQRKELTDLDSFWQKTILDPEYRLNVMDKVLSELHREDFYTCSWEFSAVKKTGESVDLFVCAIKLQKGNQIVFSIQDVTDKKSAEERLKKRNDFIETVLENLPIGLTVETADKHEFLYINKKFEEITGWPREVLIKDRGGLFAALFPDPNYRKEVYRRVSADMATGDPKRMVWEGTYTKKTGETADILGIGIPVHKENLIVVTSQDITERKRAEREVLKLNQELEARVLDRTRELELANRELEAFTYSVSHDLRAPLRAIDGFSEALLEEYEDKLDDEGKTYLRYLQEGSHEMSDLIDGLLMLSRSTRGELYLEQVDLSAMAGTVIADLRKAEPERRVTVRVAAGVEVCADPRLLKVVLENLLGNAWKYTSKRSDARVEFGVEDKEKETVYFVRDNGAGFDMAYADKLFLPFHRLHKSDEFPGIGIGLATVQRIIHRHCGLIWADSAVGEGATFYFTLRMEGSHNEK